ncbi:MAG: sodium:solute symporter [Saprospiraceae bacterium]|nr:sodium:solute symporter [Saprospiraceae bacterium]
MSPLLILSIIGGYFLFLMIISYVTSKGSQSEDFFVGGRQSPWYIVAFGMIGATLSGVTFISIPGFVGDSKFSYMQVVLGYIVGYIIIAFVLMPMYYRLRLTSIYTYLEKRFGWRAYKTGAAYFLLSRSIGAAFRLFLVAIVLQQFLMQPFGVPFAATILFTIGLIWIYTFRGGIKTIVWTDTLQTASMLIAVIATIIVLGREMNLGAWEIVETVRQSELSQIWFFEGGWSDSENFFKQFLSGIFITIVMTGLDQDMMQKNLSCRNLRDAQKNMMTMTGVLVLANLLFLSLGVLLYLYTAQIGLEMPTRIVNGEAKAASDLLYPTLALGYLSPAVGIVFLIGLIAAAYSSADSALTALTTSFCIDFLGFEKSALSEGQKRKRRLWVHLGFSFLLFLIIMIFYYLNDQAVIKALFRIAGYTYGPLLGLYAFGFFINRKSNDKFIPLVCILAPLISLLIDTFSDQLLWGYKFGFEILILNGIITFLGLWLFSRPEQTDSSLLSSHAVKS